MKAGGSGLANHRQLSEHPCGICKCDFPGSSKELSRRRKYSVATRPTTLMLDRRSLLPWEPRVTAMPRPPDCKGTRNQVPADGMSLSSGLKQEGCRHSVHGRHASLFLIRTVACIPLPLSNPARSKCFSHNTRFLSPQDPQHSPPQAWHPALRYSST